MARRRNPVAQWAVAWICVAFAKFTELLPLAACRLLGRFLGRLAYYIVPRIRTVGMANLDLAYGETLNRAEKRRILKGAAENVGIVAAEFSKIPKLHGDFLKRYVTVTGLELIDFDRGGMLISGHCGNWEWMAPACHGSGYRVAEVVRPLDHPRFNALVNGTRTAGLDKTIPKESAGPEMIRMLQEGWLVGVLVDQSPRVSGVPVNFFGAPCWATVAPVMAAVRARVPVYGISLTRDAHGHYTLSVRTKIEVKRSNDPQRDLVEYSQRCQDFVESVIREYPEQWLWLHRRWKPRPRLEREWQKKSERQTKAP
ncbi:MAG: hypothetical protein HZB26_03920 [Candidatus Hydrogenedentes bacterium]|nr:hypothetical protein [Candidatus Hydrogenedentota bacterium]